MATKESSNPFLTENAAIAQANNHLALALYKVLSEEKVNLFFSPLSLSSALAMLFCGATDKTSEEMRKVLGYDIANITDSGLRSGFELLLTAVEETREAYTLSCANSLLVQKGFNVQEDYKTTLEVPFKSLMLEVDFMRESEEVLNQINEWVKGKTCGMIPQMLQSLDSSTVMAILNAVYFKGAWLSQFQVRNTRPGNFYNKGLDENAKNVETMNQTMSFPYIAKETFTALQLPYRGEEIAMLILLPRSRNGLEELESHFTPDFLRDITENLNVRKVEVQLPKFRLEYAKLLNEQFQAMGMRKAFRAGADFGGISVSRDLRVSHIIHKAVLVVNEEGSEAAAAAVIRIRQQCLMKLHPEFIVDHPFAFIIRDTRNDLILFMGRVDEL